VTTANQLSRFRLATGAARVLPDFVIIGAQKCGTSSLYRYLAAHPSVAPAARKEVHYFDWGYQRGLNWYRAHFPTAVYRTAFQTITGRPLYVGEASPYYLFHPYVPARMKKLLPAAKLIVLLRDPVERALSSYQHQVRRKRESLPFLEAMAAEPERLAPEIERMARDETYNSTVHRHLSYLARGEYADQLASWLDVYPRQQLLVIRSEDFFDDTAGIFAQVLAFLDLPAWLPSTFRQFNAAEYPDMDPAIRRGLVEYFAPHNERLHQLLGRDFRWSR
jgi:hypothetical protein